MESGSSSRDHEGSKEEAILDENVLFVMRNKEEYMRTLHVHNEDIENSEGGILRLLSSKESTLLLA